MTNYCSGISDEGMGQVSMASPELALQHFDVESAMAIAASLRLADVLYVLLSLRASPTHEQTSRISDT